MKRSSVIRLRWPRSSRCGGPRGLCGSPHALPPPLPAATGAAQSKGGQEQAAVEPAGGSTWAARLRGRWAELRQHERVLSVMVSTSVMMTGHGILTPVLPLFADSLGATTAQLGMSLSAFAVARLLLNVPLGIIADRYGRRLLLVAGPLVNAVGMGGSVMAGSVGELLLWRLVAGAGNAAYLGGASMYLNDIATKENRGRIIGANHAAILFGVSLGPAMGGFLASTGGIMTPFAVVATAGVATAAYAHRHLPETMPQFAPDAEKKAVPTSCNVATNVTATCDSQRSGGKVAGASSLVAAKRLLSDPRFLAAGAANAASFSLRQGGRNVLLVVHATTIHQYTVSQLGALFSAIAAVDFLLIWPSATLADKVDRRLIVAPSMVGAGLAVGCLASTGGSHAAFLGCEGLWALSTAANGPSMQAYAVDIVPPQHRGLGIALFRTLGDVGFVAMPVLCGAIADVYSVEVAFQFLGTMVIGSGLSFALAARPPASDSQ